jgi:hypothetical protein
LFCCCHRAFFFSLARDSFCGSLYCMRQPNSVLFDIRGSRESNFSVRSQKTVKCFSSLALRARV